MTKLFRTGTTRRVINNNNIENNNLNSKQKI